MVHLWQLLNIIGFSGLRPRLNGHEYVTVDRVDPGGPLGAYSGTERCLHTYFEAQAGSTPGATAVEYEGRRLTYGELNARANLLARRLARAGVGPDVLVGLCLERSLEIVIGVLGILKAGGAYVPLDPDNPPQRLALILADAKPPVIVTHTALLDGLPAGEFDAVCLDEFPWHEAAGRDNPAFPANVENLAYVLFTSGSTGQPKGALINHRSVVRLLCGAGQWFDFGADDIWAVFHSFAFDVSVWELWGALLHGGKAIIIPSGVARAPATFYEVLHKERITVLCHTPSAFYPLIEQDQKAGEALPLALRYIIFAGEALEFQRLKPWVARHREEPALINMYGPTEATVYSTYYEIPKDRLDAGSIIGVPIPGQQLHLLDEDRAPVPQGAIGEIYIGGCGLARGYLNRPDLTAERFIPDPFSAEPSARLYKTGDRGRLGTDGQIEFCGRVDYQVKLRGYRIELGEIETALNRVPGVGQSVVVLRDAPTGDKELVAYLLADGSTSPTPTSLRAHLVTMLPPYMVPAGFVVLPAWPLNHAGKLDRSALPAPGRGHRVELPFAPPRTDIEAQVAAIWMEALAIGEVGTFDDYFDLGAHSLMISQVCIRLQDSFDVPLSIADVLQARTVANLAATIDAMVRRGSAGAGPTGIEHGRDSNPPTSYSQDTILFLHELAPDSLAYNNQVTIRLTGELDIAVLRRSLEEIVRRHESLRTTYERGTDGKWYQLVHPPWRVTLPVIDAAPGEFQHLFEHRFNPARLPLVHWALVRNGPREHILVHVEHHLIHDGWSFGVFMHEMSTLYAAYRNGEKSPLPEVTAQYADFCLQQRKRLQGDTLDRLRLYWTSKLAGASPILDLPTDRSRPSLQTFRGDELQINLSPRLAGALRDFSRAHRCSLFSIMLAGFAALLRRYTAQDDPIIGSGYVNREHKGSETIIGMIVNMLPLRVDMAGDPAFDELVRRAHRLSLETLAHQELPFNLIVNSLGLPSDPSRNPLVQVTFNWHDSPLPITPMPGLTCAIEYPHNGSAKFDMNVIVIPRAEQQVGIPAEMRDQRITIRWDFNSDLFDRATIERMLERYVRVLEAGMANPQICLSDIVPLDDAERRHLAEWNETARDYPRERPVHALFEEQAERRPTAAALLFGDTVVSYRELNERANKLAHYLRRHGVGPEVKVGLYIERSIEMVVGILGILKAGGAYVPLDPDYPAKRLSFMLRDTRAKVLLTQSHLRDRIAAYDGSIFCLDRDWHAIADESPANPAAAATADNLAYVIYTSGSTGTPKGVCVPHRGVVRLVKNTNFVTSGPGEVFFQFAPISFDASIFELFGSLLNGARLAVFAPGVPSLATLAEAIRKNEVTTLWLTATLFHQMVDFELDTLKRVPQILAGGEALSVAHVRRMLKALPPGHRLINGYGPTENSTFTTCHMMTRDSVVGRSVPIGKPIANTQAYILDEHRRPVPEGLPGELYAGGDGLARGYLNQSMLTAERFVIVGGRRLYRTGDRARHLADGSIEFLGRADEQIKLRGYRIELGEIETTLNQHPSVRDCVVQLRSAASGEKRLVAFVTGKDGAPAHPDILRAHVKAELPAYMVPSDFVTLDSLPLTPVGKIDRTLLAAFAGPAPAAPKAQAKPRTPTERLVADIWSKYLDLPEIGIDENFFDLGGHSLSAASVFAELRERCDVALPLALLFERPTVAALAQAIIERQSERGSNLVIPVQPAGRKPPIFAMLGIGGSYGAYAALTKALGEDQPFYSLEMPGLEDESMPLQRIEEIADKLRVEITGIRAGQPCVLLGACAGAPVAFEMARRLPAEGRSVAQVIMIDPPPTGTKRGHHARAHILWQRLLLPRFVLYRCWQHMMTLARLKGEARRAFLQEKLAVVREIIAKRDLLRASRREVQAARVLEATNAALTGFSPQAYEGRVALLLGDRYDPAGAELAVADWRSLCTGSLEVARITGKDTGSMFRSPCLEVLVSRLKPLLGSD